MRAVNIKWDVVVFIALVGAALWLRLTWYEPIDRSVSNFDTVRYTQSSDASVFSADFYTSIRQPTVALAYQLAESSSGYQVTNLSSPGDFIQPPLQIQSGFDRITELQSVFSIAVWTLLAWAVFRNLAKPAFKALGALLVLSFGFTPQIVEWDYVMLSEPISLSLFVLLLALSIELVARVVGEAKPANQKTLILLMGWFITLLLWAFARDTNAYMLLIFSGAAFLLAVWRPSREKLSLLNIIVIAILLLALFVAAAGTAQLSGRWVNAYFNNLLVHVLPVPEYQAFFEARGLPVTDKLLAEVGGNLTELSLFEMTDLVNWVEQKGPSTYVEFILNHPGWALGTFFEGIKLAFTENAQPFFRRGEVTPGFFVFLGSTLHVKDAGIIFIVTFELGVLFALAAKSRTTQAAALAGLFGLFFTGEIFTLFVAIHGDASSIVRHSIGSIMPLRLMVWLLPPFILDTLSAHRSQSQ